MGQHFSCQPIIAILKVISSRKPQFLLARYRPSVRPPRPDKLTSGDCLYRLPLLFLPLCLLSALYSQGHFVLALACQPTHRRQFKTSGPYSTFLSICDCLPVCCFLLCFETSVVRWSPPNCKDAFDFCIAKSGASSQSLGFFPFRSRSLVGSYVHFVFICVSDLSFLVPLSSLVPDFIGTPFLSGSQWVIFSSSLISLALRQLFTLYSISSQN